MSQGQESSWVRAQIEVGLGIWISAQIESCSGLWARIECKSGAWVRVRNDFFRLMDLDEGQNVSQWQESRSEHKRSSEIRLRIKYESRSGMLAKVGSDSGSGM